MKFPHSPFLRVLILLGWVLLTALELAFARPVKLAWNPPTDTVTGWRVWRGIDMIGSSDTPSATVEAKTGDILTVTAYNSAGESAHSSPVTIPPPLVWIQKSTDLQTWQNVIQIEYHPAQFIRLEIPAP